MHTDTRVSGHQDPCRSSEGPGASAVGAEGWGWATGSCGSPGFRMKTGYLTQVPDAPSLRRRSWASARGSGGCALGPPFPLNGENSSDDFFSNIFY